LFIGLLDIVVVVFGIIGAVVKFIPKNIHMMISRKIRQMAVKYLAIFLKAHPKIKLPP
jgi:hypothetical protein